MSVISDRFDRILRLAQKGNLERSWSDQWILNELQLRNVIDMKALRRMKGWQIIEQYLSTQIQQNRDRALELSGDPEKNHNDLIMNAAVAFVCRKILKLVSDTVGRERELVDERAILDAQRPKQ